MKIELVEKLLKKILKEEDLRQAGAYRGASFQDIERQTAQQQSKVWGPDNTMVWFFQINKQPTQQQDVYNYNVTLGKKLSWQNTKALVDIQSSPNEKERIPYKPNVFVRNQQIDIITGFVVGQNEAEARKLLDNYVREQRMADQKSGQTRM